MSEELVLSSHFSDHMVLQRAPARAMIWGAVNVRDNRTVVLILTPAAGGAKKTYSLNTTKGGIELRDKSLLLFYSQLS